MASLNCSLSTSLRRTSAPAYRVEISFQAATPEKGLGLRSSYASLTWLYMSGTVVFTAFVICVLNIFIIAISLSSAALLLSLSVLTAAQLSWDIGAPHSMACSITFCESVEVGSERSSFVRMSAFLEPRPPAGSSALLCMYSSPPACGCILKIMFINHGCPCDAARIVSAESAVHFFTVSFLGTSWTNSNFSRGFL